MPNFLYIGLSKSASTYIYQICKEHPEIYMPVIKDIFFFDREYERGLDWYQRFFQTAPEHKAVGEISHDYLFQPEACKRIKQDLPNIKLIVCMREPLDWVVSKQDNEECRRMLAASTWLEFAQGKYAAQEMLLSQNLARYFDSFDQEQILVLFYDELKANPQAFCQKIYSFLGVDQEFKAESLEKTILPAQKPRFKLFAVLAQAFCDLCRFMGWQKLLGWLKNQEELDGLIFADKTEQDPIPVNERDDLINYYASEVLGLQNLNLELPSSWLEIYQRKEAK
ncbi:MAG: sulfotransferase [Candidatus Melainabacteria bacterium]|nr:sulfotransferase [Candidatus Melainabacteria bacterium]